MTSAAIWPPALRTSSRNSPRDSSTSRPGASRLEAWEPDEYDSGAEALGGSVSTRAVVAFAPFNLARLAFERTSRSTATKTARSDVLPERPGSADEDCDRPQALPGLFASRGNLRMLPD